jgi:hypothetical protein
MLKKLFALSAVAVTVVAFSSSAEAAKCCKHKRARKCCKKVHYTCPAPCGVCSTPAAAAPAVEAPATEAAPEPPAEKK